MYAASLRAGDVSTVGQSVTGDLAITAGGGPAFGTAGGLALGAFPGWALAQAAGKAAGARRSRCRLPSFVLIDHLAPPPGWSRRSGRPAAPLPLLTAIAAE